MKSNYQLTPSEHLENRRLKYTHKKDSLHFFYIIQLIYKENRTDVFFSKPNQNLNQTQPAVCLKTEPNLKNPFCTSLFLIIQVRYRKGPLSQRSAHAEQHAQTKTNTNPKEALS